MSGTATAEKAKDQKNENKTKTEAAPAAKAGVPASAPTEARKTLTTAFAGKTKDQTDKAIYEAYKTEEVKDGGKRASDVRRYAIVTEVPEIKADTTEKDGKMVVVGYKSTGKDIFLPLNICFAAKAVTGMERSEFTTADAVACFHKLGYTLQQDGNDYKPAVKEKVAKEPKAPKEPKAGKKAATPEAKANAAAAPEAE